MPEWLSTMILAVMTSGATTVVLSLTVGPRLEARNRRIQRQHQARDDFGDAVFTMLTLSARLGPIAEELAPELREELESERQRWGQDLDEATLLLANEVTRYALTYPTDRMRQIIVKYGACVRGIWRSQRSEHEKVELINTLSSLIHEMMFGPIRRRVTRFAAARTELEAKFESLLETEKPKAIEPTAAEQQSEPE